MTNLDAKLFSTINDLAGHSQIWDGIMSFLAEYSLWIFGLVMLWYLFKNRRIFWTSLFAAILSRGVFTIIIRSLYHRTRPFVVLPGAIRLIAQDPAEASFPSGHTAFLFAIAFAVYLYDKTIGSILILAALVMSFARVYTGVHYPLDIVGGIAVGLVSALMVKFFSRNKISTSGQ